MRDVKNGLLGELGFPILITKSGKLCFKNRAAELLISPPRRGAAFSPCSGLPKEDGEHNWRENGILLKLAIRGTTIPTWVFPMEYEGEPAEGWTFLPELMQEQFAELFDITEFALQTVAVAFGDAISALGKRAKDADAVRQFRTFYTQKQRTERLLHSSALSLPSIGGRHKLSLSAWLGRSLTAAIGEIGGSLSYQEDPLFPLSACYADYRRYSAVILRICTFLLSLSEDGKLSIFGKTEDIHGSLLCRIRPRTLPKEADGFSGDLLTFVAKVFPAEYPMLFLQELLSASPDISFAATGVQVENGTLHLCLPFTLSEADLLCQPMEIEDGDDTKEAAALLVQLFTELRLFSKGTPKSRRITALTGLPKRPRLGREEPLLRRSTSAVPLLRLVIV